MAGWWELLCSTGSLIWCSVVTWRDGLGRGGEGWGGREYTYTMADLPCCMQRPAQHCKNLKKIILLPLLYMNVYVIYIYIYTYIYHSVVLYIYKTYTYLCIYILNIILYFQFSSVAHLCPTLCDTRDCSTSVFPVHHQLLELAQTHVHWVGNAIQPCHPLSLPIGDLYKI